MQNSKIILFILILFMIQTACTPPRPTQPPSSGNSPIGSVSRVSDVVQRNNQQVATSNQLFQDDSLRLLDGGEGLLDFGSDLRLRLFNDTQVGGVRTSTAPGTPLIIKLALFTGGFTGQLFRPGSQASFDTPNGGQITVFGTTFLIVYDDQTGWTTACNFEGSMEVVSDSSPAQPVDPGAFRQISPDGGITPLQALTFSVAEWEDRARAMASPVGALGSMGVTTGEPKPGEDQTPPGIEVLAVEPPSLAIGPECPGAPNTAQVTVGVFDDSPINNVVSSWQSGDRLWEIPMDRIDDQTYTATIGPFESPGDFLITIFAEDAWGNLNQTDTVLVVQICIG